MFCSGFPPAEMMMGPGNTPVGGSGNGMNHDALSAAALVAATATATATATAAAVMGIEDQRQQNPAMNPSNQFANMQVKTSKWQEYVLREEKR